MRRFGVLVCAALLSVQGFAIKGVTGKGTRPIKQLLSAVNGGSNLTVNSGNVGTKLLVAALGAGMLFTVTAADANIEKRSKELDKKLGRAKVIELDNGLELDAKGRLFGSYADNSDKANIFNFGVGADVGLRQALTELSLSGKIIHNSTKELGMDDYTGAEDYTGRAVLLQGIPVGDDAVARPILYAEGGGAQYGNNKRQADASVGAGIQFTRELFGKRMELQVRGGVGGIWEGMYEGNDNYADLEGGAATVFGATLKTGWVSLGQFVGAEESSLLHYLPIIPGGNFSFYQYNPLEDGEFEDWTRRVEGNISIVNGLGVSFEWNKKSGEQAHRAVLASLSYDIF